MFSFPLKAAKSRKAILKGKKNQRAKTQEALEIIFKGFRISKICMKYPQLQEKISKLPRWRPQRKYRQGKSQVVEYLTQLDLFIWKLKMGDLSKFWDGYDNQPICLIDDPATPTVVRTGDEEYRCAIRLQMISRYLPHRLSRLSKISRYLAISI